MSEGTTMYCGDNCNHTGPHRYRPAQSQNPEVPWRDETLHYPVPDPRTAEERLAALLHDEYGCRITCRGGRLANDGDPSHVEAYREQAKRLLAALAAEPVPLEVERLARALVREQDTDPAADEPLWDILGERSREQFIRKAEDIAREYAALATQPEPERKEK